MVIPMKFDCAILKLRSETDKEMIYHTMIDIPQISSLSSHGKNIIPTVISETITHILSTNIPEELDAIIRSNSIRFKVTGPGVNVEFDLKGNKYLHK